MMIGRPKLVLASGSPRRVSLLNQTGIEPDALRPTDVDETPLRAEHPRSLAKRLSRAKAERALAVLKEDGETESTFVVAADTPERVEELLTSYMDRIARDFHAVLPAADKVSH